MTGVSSPFFEDRTRAEPLQGEVPGSTGTAESTESAGVQAWIEANAEFSVTTVNVATRARAKTIRTPVETAYTGVSSPVMTFERVTVRKSTRLSIHEPFDVEDRQGMLVIERGRRRPDQCQGPRRWIPLRGL